MPADADAVAPPHHAGALLRRWRDLRRRSQLDLALDADVSPRHLSCVETGKARPSVELLVRLADALDLPLRERNALMVAAGFAPRHPRTPLGTAPLAPMQRAIDALLRQQEPFPAFLLDRTWTVLRANAAAARITRAVVGHDGRHDNMVRRFLDPQDLRPFVINWEEVAGDLVRHLHDEVAAAPTDPAARALLDDVLAYPDVPRDWRIRDAVQPPPPVLTVVFRHPAHPLRFFSTIATFGTPHDVTLDELRIECAFPGDDATEAFCRRLAAEAQAEGDVAG